MVFMSAKVHKFWLFVLLSTGCQSWGFGDDFDTHATLTESQRVVEVTYWVKSKWLYRAFCIDSPSVNSKCSSLESRIPLSVFKHTWSRQVESRLLVYSDLLEQHAAQITQQSDSSQRESMSDVLSKYQRYIRELEQSKVSFDGWLSKAADLVNYSLPSSGSSGSKDLFELLIHDTFGMSQFQIWDHDGYLWRFGGSGISFLGASSLCHSLFGDYVLPTDADAQRIIKVGLESTGLYAILRVHYPEFSNHKSFWVRDIPAISQYDGKIEDLVDGRAWARAFTAGQVAGQFIEYEGYASLFCRSKDPIQKTKKHNH